MTYTKPEWKPVTTELNDDPDQMKMDRAWAQVMEGPRAFIRIPEEGVVHFVKSFLER